MVRNITRAIPDGLKPKDLVGIPWRVAFALQADGWYLRQDIIWHKPNPMPESVTDRCTKAHEYIFLMTKSARYYYDSEAVKEAATKAPDEKPSAYKYEGNDPLYATKQGIVAARCKDYRETGRNRRSVWTVPTQPFAGAHFATFPEALVEPCILAGSAPKACGVCGGPWARVTERQGIQRAVVGKTVDKQAQGLRTAFSGAVPGTPTSPSIITTGWQPTCGHDDPTGKSIVLDPFVGSGTTVRVANRLGRVGVGLDVSREYLAEQALARVDPLAAARRDHQQGKSPQATLL